MASRPSKFDHPHPRRPHGTIRCPVDIVQGSLAQCAPQIGCRRHVANVLIFMLSQRFQSYDLLAERVCGSLASDLSRHSKLKVLVQSLKITGADLSPGSEAMNHQVWKLLVRDS